MRKWYTGHIIRLGGRYDGKKNKVEFFDSFGAVKDALSKAADATATKATEALDANNDGTFDIQDVIILAVRTPGVHVTRSSFLRKEPGGIA